MHVQAPAPTYPAAVLFDLDGTLVNTIPDLAHAIDAMRADFRLPPIGPVVTATYVGQGVESLVARAIAHGGKSPTADIAAHALDSFRRHYRDWNGRDAALYAGVSDGLEGWRRAARKLAVVTNKSAEFTLPLLDHLQLARYFDAVVCGDTCARKKPAPEPLLYACTQLGIAPADALMIGDSSNDACAARAAGVRALAVPYGYHGDTAPEALPVAAVVSSIADSVAWAAANWSRGDGALRASAG